MEEDESFIRDCVVYMKVEETIFLLKHLITFDLCLFTSSISNIILGDTWS